MFWSVGDHRRKAAAAAAVHHDLSSLSSLAESVIGPRSGLSSARPQTRTCAAEYPHSLRDE